MIPYEERRAVYEAAIAHYGEESQIWMAVEEMSELTKELAKLHREKGTTVEALVDEIADVTIMMEQLRLIFKANEDVQARIGFKVTRLQERIRLDAGTGIPRLEGPPELTPVQISILQTYAKYSMHLVKTARATHYSRGSVSYHLKRVKEITGLDPLTFNGLQMLMAMYNDTREAGTNENL